MWRFYFGGVTVNADGPGFPNVRRRIAGWFLRFRYYLTFVLEGTTVVPWDSTVEPTVETLKDWRTAGDWSYVIRKFPEVASKLRTLVNFMSYIVPVEYESAEHPEWVKPKAPLRLLNLSAKREPYEVIFDGKISARLLVHLNRNDLQDDDPNNPILPVGFLSPLVPRYVDRHATRTQFSDSEIFNAGNAAQRKMMENRLLDLLFSAKRSRAVRMEVRDEPQFTLQQCIRKPMVMTYNKGNEARGGRPIPVTFWRFSTDSKHSRIMIFLRTKNVLRKTDPHYRRRFAHSIAEFYKKRRKPLYPWPTPPAQATEGQMINFYSCPGTPAATWVLGLNCKILGNDFGERNAIQEVDMDLFYRQQPAPVDPTNLVAVKNAKRQRDSFIRTLKGRFMYHLTGQARFNHLENKVARAAHDPPPGQLPVSQAIEMLKGLKRQFLQQPDPREMFFYQTIKYRVQASIRDFFYSKLHMQRVYELKVDKGRAAQLTALWKRGVMYPNTYRAARDNVGEPRELDEPELFHLRTVPKMRRQKYRLVSQQFDPTKRGAADTRDPEYRRPISPFRAALHVFDLPRWMWNGPVAQTGQFSIVRWMACQGATVGFVPDQRTSDACLLDNIRTGGHGHRLVATTVSKTKCPRDHVLERRRVKGHHRHRNFCLTSNRWASECPDRDVDHNHKTHRLKRCDRPAGAGHEHLVDPPAGHAGNMRRFFFERDTIGGGNTGYRAIFHCFNRGAIPHFQLTPGARRWGIGPAPPGAWPGDPQPFPHQLAGGNDSDPDDDDDDAEGIG
ncbi:hypothetical protein DFJ74DRAFT_665606 [Hyaloraphidium curvatum]|nr:hypothetical protein DFJ74DRAFT_665606 [Hyaloraphidium curvatum]